MLTNAKEGELQKALETTNTKYNGNLKIIWGTRQRNGRIISFRLGVHSSKGLGHRLGYPHWDFKTGKKEGVQRRLACACWHAHGDFFDALLSLNNKVRIYTRGKHKITSRGGNWEDWDAGSMMFPVMISDLCECGTEPIIEVPTYEKALYY